MTLNAVPSLLHGVRQENPSFCGFVRDTSQQEVAGADRGDV